MHSTNNSSTSAVPTGSVESLTSLVDDMIVYITKLQTKFEVTMKALRLLC